MTYLVQGWVAGSEGLSRTHTIAIVLAEALNVAWMFWLVVVARRMPDSEPVSPSRLKAAAAPAAKARTK